LNRKVWKIDSKNRQPWVHLEVFGFLEKSPILTEVHPRKQTWNPKMMTWKILLFKGVIFTIHVSFRGVLSASKHGHATEMT